MLSNGRSADQQRKPDAEPNRDDAAALRLLEPRLAQTSAPRVCITTGANWLRRRGGKSGCEMRQRTSFMALKTCSSLRWVGLGLRHGLHRRRLELVGQHTSHTRSVAGVVAHILMRDGDLFFF